MKNAQQSGYTSINMMLVAEDGLLEPLLFQFHIFRYAVCEVHYIHLTLNDTIITFRVIVQFAVIL